MNLVIEQLFIAAEEGGFQVAIVWPAKRAKYLTFEIVGKATSRGLTAATELRDLFNSSPERADEIFNSLVSVGGALQPADEPQQIRYFDEHPSVNDPVHLGEEVIFLHDGPEGWGVLTRIEHIENGMVRIDTPAGAYLFSADGGLQRAVQRPDTKDAAKLDTWILPATLAKRSAYLNDDYLASTPANQIEKLVRHSPSQQQG